MVIPLLANQDLTPMLFERASIRNKSMLLIKINMPSHFMRLIYYKFEISLRNDKQSMN